MSVNPLHLRDYIVRPVLKYMGLWSKSSENLLIGTVFQESAGGVYLKQLGNGPALGIYQIEPATHDDCWDNYIEYRTALKERIEQLMTTEDWQQQLISNLSYATAMARIVYYRKPEALPADPEDIPALAAYWKTHYNTFQGKGSVDEFIRNFPKTILES